MLFLTCNNTVFEKTIKMIVKFPNTTLYLEESEVDQIPLLKEIDVLECENQTINLTIGEEILYALITGDWFNVELNSESEQLFSYFGIENIPEELILIDEIRKSFPFSYTDYTKFNIWQLKCHIAFEKSKIEYAEIMNDLVYHPNKKSKYIQEYRDFMGKETDVFHYGVRVYTFVKYLIKDDTLRLIILGKESCHIYSKTYSTCISVNHYEINGKRDYCIMGTICLENENFHFTSSITFFGFFWQVFNRTNFLFSPKYFYEYLNSYHFI